MLNIFRKLINIATRNKREKAGEKINFFHPASLCSTVFGVGLIPFAPGTFGALVGIILPFPLLFLSFVLYNFFFAETDSHKILFISLFFLAVQLIITFGGAYAANVYMRKTKIEDPSAIVIDEVLGSLAAFSTSLVIVDLLVNFLPQYFANSPDNSYGWIILSPLFYLVMFLFFRLFDIWKPGPVGYIDRNMKGGMGVMLDDVVAGILAGIATNLIFIVWWFIIS